MIEGKIIRPDWVKPGATPVEEKNAWQRMQSAVGFPSPETTQLKNFFNNRDRKPMIVISRAKKTR